MHSLAETGKQNWASQVKQVLLSYGFGYAWFEQQVGDPEMFLRIFIERITDCAHQDWFARVTESNFLICYSSFKYNLTIEKYLTTITSFKFRQQVARFRCGLYIRKDLYSSTGNHLQDCKYCALALANNIYVEGSIQYSEYHILFNCPLYNNLREMYLKDFITVTYPRYDHDSYDEFKFRSIMQQNDSQQLLNMAKFLKAARKLYLEKLFFNMKTCVF